MNLLATIKQEDLFPGENSEMENARNRQAARAIVFDENEKIALLNVANHEYHKLPGGRVKEKENLMEALQREAMEETGLSILVMGEVGKIIEYRKNFNLIQESFCYSAKVIGEKGVPNFTQKEKDNGFEILWVALPEAIEILKNDQPDDYVGKFIQKRDLIFLEEAKNN